MLDSLAHWSSQNTGLLIALGIVVFLLLLAAIVLAPSLLAQMPNDYFLHPPVSANRTFSSLLVSTLKNAAGIILILAAMLVFFTPGPGIVLFISGIVLCEFPGKHKLLVLLVKRPSVFKLLNWLRARASTPPFLSPNND